MSICGAVWLAAHLWSVHAGPVPNNETFGVGVECDRGDYSVQLGDYRNSLGKNSAYLAVGHDWGSRFQAGLFGGVASGYQWTLVPVAGGRVRYASDDWKVQFLLMPPGERTPACVHLMLEVKL